MKTKNIFFPLFFFLFANAALCQNAETSKEKYLFKEINVNYSFVNLGIISHWHLPLNFDSKRYYQHFSIGFETSLSKNVSARLDYFSDYGKFLFFNPSIITLAPRFTFNKGSAMNIFADLKLGIAIVKSQDYYYYELASSPPPVIGFRTGINTEIVKGFYMGFSFDNMGIIYKYKYKYSSQVGYDASRISVLTTDFIYHFKK